MGKEVTTGQKVQKVSAAEGKNIMDDILGELDDQDEEDLEQVVNTGAVNFGNANVVAEDIDMAYNKDEELNLKYNISVG
jgi:hypothetical protein